jgi:hypothetical protein
VAIGNHAGDSDFDFRPRSRPAPQHHPAANFRRTLAHARQTVVSVDTTLAKNRRIDSDAVIPEMNPKFKNAKVHLHFDPARPRVTPGIEQCFSPDLEEFFLDDVIEIPTPSVDDHFEAGAA